MEGDRRVGPASDDHREAVAPLLDRAARVDHPVLRGSVGPVDQQPHLVLGVAVHLRELEALEPFGEEGLQEFTRLLDLDADLDAAALRTEATKDHVPSMEPTEAGRKTEPLQGPVVLLRATAIIDAE